MITATALITIVATIMSVDDGLARLDRGLMSGLRLGDTGAIFYEIPVGGEIQRVQVSRGTLIDVDEFGALLEVEPEFQVQAGYSIEFEIPYDRVSPQSVLELARTRLRARRGDSAVVRDLLERIIPDDEMVEGQIWRMLDDRRIARGQGPLVRGRQRDAGEIDTVVAQRSAAMRADNDQLRARLSTIEQERDHLAADLESAREQITRLRSTSPIAPSIAPSRSPGIAGSDGMRAPPGAQPSVRPDPVVLVDRVEDWAKAWSDQRDEDYLGFYARTFQPPDGLSRPAWEAERRRRIRAPKLINVAVSQVDSRAIGTDRAQVMFFQDYRSTTYSDRVFKRLTLVREDGAWKIEREDLVDVDQPFDSAAAEPQPTPPPILPPGRQPAPTVAVEAWAQAWAEQRADDYLNAYAAAFRPPDGLSREEWSALRRERIEGPAEIEVRLDNVRISPSGERAAAVFFVQSYHSDGYRDVVHKRLDLVAEAGRWKILRETVVE